MRNVLKYIPLFCVLILYVILSNIVTPLTEAIEVSSKNYFHNVVVVLDAGHGGRDNGASNGSVVEDELNLKVCEKMKERLEMMGAEVILTRDGDYDLASDNASNRKREDMKARVDIIDNSEAVMFISIHMNKYGAEYVSGAQVFYRVNDEASKGLAKSIQNALYESTATKKDIKIGNYYILNESKVNGVLVECGFLSNNDELEKLQSDTYQSELANSIVRGMYEYIDDNYGMVLN